MPRSLYNFLNVNFLEFCLLLFWLIMDNVAIGNQLFTCSEHFQPAVISLSICINDSPFSLKITFERLRFCLVSVLLNRYDVTK